MPLSQWGSLSEGISTGLRNVATIRNIQREQEQEERALRGEVRRKTLDERATEEFGQRKTLWEQQNKPTVDPMGLINSVPDLDEEQKGKVATFVKGRTGLDLTKTISWAQTEKVHKDVLSDDDFVTQVKDWQRINKTAKLTAAKERLAAIEAGEDPTVAELPPLAQRGTYQQQKSIVTDLEKDLAIHNARDKAYLAAETLKLKQTEERRKERETTHKEAEEERKVAEETRKAGKAEADKYEEVIVLRDRHPVGSDKWKQYNASAEAIAKHQKELRKHDAAAAASREFAPTNLQKDFGFYKRLYPDETNEETLARVQKQDIPSEKKFIIDMVGKAKTAGDDIVIAENEARALYRKLTGGAEKDAVSPQEKKTFAVQAKTRLQGVTDPVVQKTLQRQLATEILRMAGGNKDSARKLAKEMGLSDSLGVK